MGAQYVVGVKVLLPVVPVLVVQQGCLLGEIETPYLYHQSSTYGVRISSTYASLIRKSARTSRKCIFVTSKMCSIIDDEPAIDVAGVCLGDETASILQSDERTRMSSAALQHAKEKTAKSLDHLRDSFLLYQRMYGRDAARDALVGIASKEFRSRRKVELLEYVSPDESQQDTKHVSKTTANDNSSSSKILGLEVPKQRRYLSYRRTLGSVSSTATTITTSHSNSATSNATSSIEGSNASLIDSKQSLSNSLIGDVETSLSSTNQLCLADKSECGETPETPNSVTADGVATSSQHDSLGGDRREHHDLYGESIEPVPVASWQEVINSGTDCSREIEHSTMFNKPVRKQDDVSQSVSSVPEGIIDVNKNDYGSSLASALEVSNGNLPDVLPALPLEAHVDERVVNATISHNLSDNMSPSYKQEVMLVMNRSCIKENDDGAIVRMTNSTAASTTSRSECSATPSLANESNMSPSPNTNTRHPDFVPFPTITSSHSGEMMHCESDDDGTNSSIGNHDSFADGKDDEPCSYDLGCTSSSAGSSMRHTKSFASTASESMGQSMKEKWMASISGSSGADDSLWNDEVDSFFAGSSDPSFVPTLKSSCASGSFFIKDSLSGRDDEDERYDVETGKIDKKFNAIDINAWNTLERAIGIVESLGVKQQKQKKPPIKHCGITSSSSAQSPLSVEFMKGYLDYLHEK